MPAATPPRSPARAHRAVAPSTSVPIGTAEGAATAASGAMSAPAANSVHGGLACADVEALLGDTQAEATRLLAAIEQSERDLGNARAQKGVALEEVMAARNAPSLPVDTLVFTTCTPEDLRAALAASGTPVEGGMSALLEARAQQWWQVHAAMAAARDEVLARWVAGAARSTDQVGAPQQ